MRLDGHSGPPGERRQRYRCIPTNGDGPHRFAAPLARETSSGSCKYCERPPQLHRGPTAARQYELAAQAIAAALAAAGAGAPYRRASAVAGERSRRFGARPDGAERPFTRHARLVMDWVELFAPVVSEPHRSAAWPQTGTLLLADIPFSLRDPASARSRIGLRILCAAGYEHERLRLWRLEAYADDSASSWAAFLDGLDGMPQRVVCGAAGGVTEAVQR